MEEYILKFMLSLMNTGGVACALTLGYLVNSKLRFSRCIFVFLFSMILACYLKSIWQVPLNPALGKAGWAFPPDICSFLPQFVVG